MGNILHDAVIGNGNTASYLQVPARMMCQGDAVGCGRPAHVAFLLKANKTPLHTQRDTFGEPNLLTQHCCVQVPARMTCQEDSVVWKLPQWMTCRDGALTWGH